MVVLLWKLTFGGKFRLVRGFYKEISFERRGRLDFFLGLGMVGEGGGCGGVYIGG